MSLSPGQHLHLLRLAWRRWTLRTELAWNRRFRRHVPDDWQQRSFSEKLQWRSSHPDPRVNYARWVDKAAAKEQVRGRIRVPRNYAVVDDPRDIDPTALPDSYVMKATHGWNMSLQVVEGVALGSNRQAQPPGTPADASLLQRQAAEWIYSKAEWQRQARERHYQLLRPRILIEEYLHPIDHELNLFLFEGRCRFALALYRTFRPKGRVRVRLFDGDWKPLAPSCEEVERKWEHDAPPTPVPPRNLLDALAQICGHLGHVRADFIVVEGKYYLGEFTFTHNAGQAGFVGRYEAELGRFWPA
ncbi:MAG: hypothetical protein LJE84_05280 [Gammaproteobacteria bacterium]|nr:hypothetical protein [Gammaproteobacteria bacterium]